MEKIKILIADENTDNRKACREALLRAGFRYVDEASNGEEALNSIIRTHHDIVIADVWLSKLDGIGLIRQSANVNYSPDIHKYPAVIDTFAPVAAGLDIDHPQQKVFIALEHTAFEPEKRSGAPGNEQTEHCQQNDAAEQFLFFLPYCRIGSGGGFIFASYSHRYLVNGWILLLI